ncbi:MAG: STAS domain-containing protein [Nitrospirae bacterium]|nr:STAS domain-containing protein [Nitrospirota bacterium]
MEIELGNYKGTSVIVLSGEIDMYTSPKLREKLLHLVKKEATPVIVDLSKVTYIDSSGIATFVESFKRMKSYEGKLQLVSIPDRVMNIFNFSKLDKVFEMYGSVEDALGE